MKPKLNRDHRNYTDKNFSYLPRKIKFPKEIKIKPQTQFKNESTATVTHSHGPTEAGGELGAGSIQMTLSTGGRCRQREVTGRQISQNHIQNTTVVIKNKERDPGHPWPRS